MLIIKAGTHVCRSSSRVCTFSSRLSSGTTGMHKNKPHRPHTATTRELTRGICMIRTRKRVRLCCAILKHVALLPGLQFKLQLPLCAFVLHPSDKAYACAQIPGFSRMLRSQKRPMGPTLSYTAVPCTLGSLAQAKAHKRKGTDLGHLAAPSQCFSAIP